ncbi:MAG TPA: hypothetical protein VIF15_18420 [Polyangiaceae bacterium]
MRRSQMSCIRCRRSLAGSSAGLASEDVVVAGGAPADAVVDPRNTTESNADIIASASTPAGKRRFVTIPGQQEYPIGRGD